MNVIGINAFHGDSSACLVVDGSLLSAIEEERLLRVKHWAGFPSKSIDYCLKRNGLNLSDIDLIAINTDPAHARWQKASYVFSGKASWGLVKEKLLTRQRRQSIEQHLECSFPNQAFLGKVVNVEHHLAHLASTYYASGFDQALAVSIDGFGDFASCAWGYGQGESLSIDKRIYFPHSLGIFYQAMTQYLGFHHYGDEYKVMGLAPYGNATYMTELESVLQLSGNGGFRLNLDFFSHQKSAIGYEWDGGSPKVSQLYTAELENVFGPARDREQPLKQKHMDFAHSVQMSYEKAVFNLLNAQHSNYGSNKLCLAGGCAMNSVANGKIHLNTDFREIYVQPAAGDAGGAIGAAMVATQQAGVGLNARMPHAYWGNTASDDELQTLLEQNATELRDCTIKHYSSEIELVDKVSSLIIEGKVIGWFQGAMEWGPRALGNRSILADPRRDDMKDILNSKIKRRESFRPFAPSVLREEVSDWFESDAEVPFMMKVFQVKEDKRARIPAVTHVDGSGRLQTVTEHSNSRYYRLISAFHQKTSVPMLLNTSFNENEPVVSSPAQALDCFLRTNMDVLVLNSYLIER